MVAGCHACEEDEWEKLAIGGNVEVTAVKPCDRCKVSTASSASRLADHLRLQNVASQPCMLQ